MNKIIIICGPTATGKTSLAVKIAKKFNGELISADSRQVYIGMDIGTGKDAEELGSIPMWMYDVVRPDEKFSVSEYRALAREAIEDIQKRGKLPIVVGGTGLYIDSIARKHSAYTVIPDDTLRSQLANLTVEELQKMLHLMSPELFEKLNNSDKHNSRRLIRKIELAKHTDMQSVDVENNYSVLSIGLTISLEQLKQRIDSRVDARVAAGQLQEVRGLLSRGYSWELPAMSGFGYKQWRRVLEGSPGEEKRRTYEAILEWKLREFQYAKRQMTWFKKDPTIVWMDANSVDLYNTVAANVSQWYYST